MLDCSVVRLLLTVCFVFLDPATTEIYTLSLHDALPIFRACAELVGATVAGGAAAGAEALDRTVTGISHDSQRSEEHTSELQSRQYLVCRLLLEKKKHNHLFVTLLHPHKHTQINTTYIEI